MASSSTQKLSSSSAPPTKFNFDVFLSFRGEDTRYNFTDHLFVKLDRMGINTFRDDQLERGKEIAQELLGAIEGSRFSIIVFSERYADSKWCLEELTKIMECRKQMDQKVLPVFYHVDPSDVRTQKGSFGKAFAKHKRTVDKEKMQRWRAAMTEAGNLGGWHVKDGYESKYIEEILKVIRQKLGSKPLDVDDDIVGMDSRLEELKSLINSQSHDVYVVGIYGTGGIGKTTIAKFVYNEIQYEFNGASFLENVKGSCQLQLQQKLLQDILGQKIELSNINDGINLIKDRLGSKKVLIVIDDVNCMEQLKPLARSTNWFGAGTTIIITTRDQQLLCNFGANVTYEVKKLDDAEAVQLFSKHAFKQNAPKNGYVDLSTCMVDYAQGLPLALKVLGCSLQGMTRDEWENALDEMKSNPKKKIINVLRLSYDMLDHPEKKVFLDIACFFEGEDKAFMSKILGSCNIRVLYDKCLITISNNMIQMHNLIQQMGWEIVREKHPEDPSKWSRLWDPNDICKAFSQQKGMENIETMSLDLSRAKEMQLSSETLATMKKVSNMMTNLRLLKVYYSDRHSSRGKVYKVFLPKHFQFPPNLVYLHWEGYTSKSLPSNFHGKNLVAINLKSSNIEVLWEGDKYLAKLKFIDLSNSKQLIKMPKFSSMPALEKLNLEGCTSLCQLHSSIAALPNMKFLKELNFTGSGIKELPSIASFESLEILNLSKCSKFEKFPAIIFVNMKHLRRLQLFQSGIKELPSSISYLESLEYLNLLGCSNFEKFPEIKGNMKHLTYLSLQGTAIKEIPNSIERLEALEILNLNGCSNFEKFPKIQKNMENLLILSIEESAIKDLPCSMGHLPRLAMLHLGNSKNLMSVQSNISKLKSLENCSLNGCSNLVAFSDITEDIDHLEDLCLRGMTIAELPSSIERLRGLTWLELTNCENLVSLPNSIGNLTCLDTLLVHNCSKLHKLPDNLRSLQQCLDTLDVSGCNLMEGAIPDDLWCLFSLVSLNLSENNIRCIPTGITQLSQLQNLHMNHCPMLEEIPKLPSSLRRIAAHDCPRLEALSSDRTCLLWSSLLNCFKSVNQDFRRRGRRNFHNDHKISRQGYPDLPHYNKMNVVIPGRSGIPEWISCESKGCEATINLPKNWYEDDSFLGFVLFFRLLPLEGTSGGDLPQCRLLISHGEQFEDVANLSFVRNCEKYLVGDSYYEFLPGDTGSTSSTDPTLLVYYFPQIAISSEYRSSGWNKFKARFTGTFGCGDKAVFEVESCGIHLIYENQQNEDQEIYDEGPSGSGRFNADSSKSKSSDCYSNESSPSGSKSSNTDGLESKNSNRYFDESSVVLQEIHDEGPSESGCFRAYLEVILENILTLIFK